MTASKRAVTLQGFRLMNVMKRIAASVSDRANIKLNFSGLVGPSGNRKRLNLVIIVCCNRDGPGV